MVYNQKAFFSFVPTNRFVEINIMHRMIVDGTKETSCQDTKQKQFKRKQKKPKTDKTSRDYFAYLQSLFCLVQQTMV